MTSPGAVVRLMLTILCTLGLISMHQLTASAMPEHGSPAAHGAMAPMAVAHHCADDGAATVEAADDCSTHQACQAIPVSPRTAPAPSATPVTVAPLETTRADASAHPVSLHASGDPPDLIVLSVSRS